MDVSGSAPEDWSKSQPWHAVFPIRFFLDQIALLSAARMMQSARYAALNTERSKVITGQVSLVLGMMLPNNFLGLAKFMPEEEFKGLYLRVCEYCKEGYPHNAPRMEPYESQKLWLDPIVKPLEAIEAVRFPDVATEIRRNTAWTQTMSLSMLIDRAHGLDAFGVNATARSAEMGVRKRELDDTLNRLSQSRLRAEERTRTQAEVSQSNGWTKAELIGFCGLNRLSGASFKRIRIAANIDAGARGHRFGVAEIAAMIMVAPKATPSVARIVEVAWRPLVSDSEQV